MFDLNHFEDVFEFNPGFTYNPPQLEKIEANRKSSEGLFVDKVLKLLELKRPSKFYPPRTNADLRSLHKAVTSSNAADHTKLSLLYYLVLDFDSTTQRQEHAEEFQEKALLPKRHQIFMKGLWHMDRLEFEIALQYLTHPSLIPTFHEEILETLIRHAKHENFTLALSYFYTVQPTITNPQAMESLFSAIVRTSVTEAFHFQRAQSESTQKQMFEMLISITMQTPPGEKASARAAELVNLPFDATEETWFEEYLSTGTGRQYKRAKDTLMMRRIATGRFGEALAVKGIDGRQIDGLSWGLIEDGLENGVGPRLGVNGTQ